MKDFFIPYSQESDVGSNVYQLGYDESGVHDWELYFFTRHRTIQYLNQSTMTLKV